MQCYSLFLLLNEYWKRAIFFSFLIHKSCHEVTAALSSHLADQEARVVGSGSLDVARSDLSLLLVKLLLLLLLLLLRLDRDAIGTVVHFH